MKVFCIRLKEARKAMGYSQKQVAELVDITASAYANYEQGTREPSLSTLVKLVAVLDTTADHLLGIEDWV